MPLIGKNAIVTGGASGIGLATCRRLARDGVGIGVWDIDYAGAQRTAAELVASGARAVACNVDVSARTQIDAGVERVHAELGKVQILVNNAGMTSFRPFLEVTEAEWERVMFVNLKSMFLCTQAVLPGMRARRWGRIVNISSGAARGAGGIGVHYNASKAGMEGLTRGYAARLVKAGITVNAVAPSLIDTDMMSARRDQYVARIPLGRMGTPAEVAQVVLMVMGNEYMTGQTVQLNGGTSFI